MNFEWDEAKNLGNQAKHGLSFEEVTELFESGSDYLEIFDSEHSEAEDRFIAIGLIARGVIVVIHTEPDEELIRIISARPASRREQDWYRSYMDDIA